MRKHLLAFFVLVSAAPAQAQLSIGAGPYLHSSSGHVNTNYGVKIEGHYLAEEVAIAQFGIILSSPVGFDGYARLDAFDSLTVPYSIIVPAQKKVKDLLVHFGFGACIIPRRRNTTL